MNACVLTIGDELLQGFTIDTNSTWIGKTLLPYGIFINKKITTGDNINCIIQETVNILNDDVDYLFITGGLGPTHDDITKEAFRRVIDSELIFNESYFNKLKAHFKKRGIKISNINRSQAMVLKNTEIIPNDIGSALGIYCYYKNSHIFIMPGVPREMKNMLINYIIPYYIKTKPKENNITIKTTGIMESKLFENISNLIEEYSNEYRFAFLPHYNGVSFRISKIKNCKNLKMVADKFFQEMQPFAYGFNNDTIEGILSENLIKRKLTIAVAESCTGGFIGKRLTDISGSSNYFLGSISAYSNDLKQTLLNISKKTLDKYGSVSREVALEMAKNIKMISNSDIGLSATGISGPNGGTKNKPVGLVYIGLVTSSKSIVKKYILNFGRSIHREMTATAAINLTRINILE